MTARTLSNRLSDNRLLFLSLGIAAALVFLLCLFFAPRWETNDDVGMSMIAHGYGAAFEGSPNILFSNVIWGYLVRLIPTVNGMLGYSLATLSVLVIVGTVILYALFQSGLHYLACFAILALILVRAILFPQFTLNAGLLAVSSVICCWLYEKRGDIKMLTMACLLAFLSCLVRNIEFALVLVVAAPLLPYRVLSRPAAKGALLILVSAIGISTLIDHQAYKGPEWKAYNDLNSARAPFTDFGAGTLLKQHPDILARHGYSANDIDLISEWFFVDPNIANPQVLKEMLAELGSLPIQPNSLANALAGVKTLGAPILLIPLLAALLFTVLRPTWRLVASWSVCLAVVFVLGLIGRPGVLRVYSPLVSMLLVAAASTGNLSGWRNRLGIAVLVVAAGVNTKNVFSESRHLRAVDEQIQKMLSAFPHFPIVIWGATFPYEAVYSVIRAPSFAMSFQHYGLGTSTVAPFALGYREEKAGRGLTTLLTQENGIFLMAYPVFIQSLEIYCQEHFQGKLRELSKVQYGSTQYGPLEISRQRCDVNR